MIYTEEQSQVILDHKNNLVNQVIRDNGKISIQQNGPKLEVKEIIHHENRGRNLTNDERALLGSMARAGLGTHREIAAEFGISTNSVDKYSTGEVSNKSCPTYKAHPELRDALEIKLEPVRERALEKLMLSLNLINEPNLEKVGAKDASIIASNMSRVVRNTTPERASIDSRVQIVMYTPPQKKLSDYKVVEI